MDEGILRVFQEHKKNLSLKTSVIGQKIYYYHKLNSTNDTAFELAINNAKEGTVVVSDIQTKGKGRLGRVWHSPIGGLYFSFILRPLLAPFNVNLITLIVALSACRALEKIGLKPQIKWPNDIIIAEKKICGILIEMDSEADRIKFLVVGIGINNETAQHDLPHGATSVYEESGIKISNRELLKVVLENLDEYYLMLVDKKMQKIIKEAESFSSLLNKRVRITVAKKETEGRVFGFDSNGALILKRNNGKVEKYFSADNLRIVKNQGSD